MTKSYVGMTRCFYCGEPNEILMDTHLNDTLDHDLGVIDTEPCSKCANYMGQGIIFLGIVPPSGEIPVVEFKDKRGRVVSRVPNPQRTGHMAVVTDNGLEHMRKSGTPARIIEFAKAHRWMFIDVDAGVKLGIWEG